MGGEKVVIRMIAAVLTGSPPRGRGKDALKSAAFIVEGITPAWAGKSCIAFDFGLNVEDHPRVGGEKLLLALSILLVRGSPPRGRGKVQQRRSTGKQAGITPAWAGKSRFAVLRSELSEDHPRVGGEKAHASKRFRLSQGSPPRGRGKVNALAFSYDGLRITPAWAGKSSMIFQPLTVFPDHPRVGGEKLSCPAHGRHYQGSPPRGRGKVPTKTYQVPKIRITPAWAGKRLMLTPNSARTWDHPRVGGEKFWLHVLWSPRRGSPPRGRGKALEFVPVSRWYRITPAWAGKRLKRSHRSGIFISGPIPFHSVLHRPAGSGGSRAGRDGSPAGQPQNTGPA